MIKLVDKMNRSVLNEGRNYQMGFAFVKKTKKNVFETVQPISPCKDYLNDVVWSERCNKDIYAFGLDYSKQDIFDGKKAYVVIKIMERFNGMDYGTIKEDRKNLKENIENLTNFINFFEDKLGLKIKTKIDNLTDDTYLLTIDNYWTTGTFLISLYTLLIRVGQFYKGDKKPLTYLKEFTEFPPDLYMVKGALPKLDRLLKGEKVTQKLMELEGGTNAHNMGIISFQF